MQNYTYFSNLLITVLITALITLNSDNMESYLASFNSKQMKQVLLFKKA